MSNNVQINSLRRAHNWCQTSTHTRVRTASIWSRTNNQEDATNIGSVWYSYILKCWRVLICNVYKRLKIFILIAHNIFSRLDLQKEIQLFFSFFSAAQIVKSFNEGSWSPMRHQTNDAFHDFVITTCYVTPRAPWARERDTQHVVILLHQQLHAIKGAP